MVLHSNMKKLGVLMSDNTPALFESKDYFEVIKSNINTITKYDIEKMLSNLLYEYENAVSINQKKLADRLRFYIASTLKYNDLIDTKFTRFVESPMISEYIDKVNPRKSVKLVEIERYCRIIPKQNAEIIKDATDLKLFDEILILYTDLTNQRNETKEEKELIARNKDPIAFGIFRDERLEISNPRFFIITDWVDEWCDLTFDKLISECVSLDVEERYGQLKSNTFKSLISKCKDIIDV